MGALSRRKGANFEREVSVALRQLAPSVRAERCLVETREGNSGDILTNLPLAIQCKVGANPPIYAAIDQAIEVARSEQIPIAVIRRNASARNRKYDLVVLPTEEFLHILRLLLRSGLTGALGVDRAI